jgi:HK97 family phage prohead protease
MNRAYSLLTVKAVDDDHRVIRGVATTPSPDRVGDIVEPLGVDFKNPMPLLWQHKSDKPVGLVKFDKPTKSGITFEATLPKIDEPGVLKDRVDEAWQSIKAGLVRAVSIGFRALEQTVMKDGGYRFVKSEVMELSLVTIPANADATITTIRSIDTELRAASGHEQPDDVSVSPGVSGKPDRAIRVVKLNPKTKGSSTMDIAEQIKSFEDARVLKADKMSEIMEVAAKKGETLDAELTEEYDGLEAEVKAIDDHLKRLRNLEKAQASTAKPVETGSKPTSETRSPQYHNTVRVEKMEPGIRFARLAKCKGLSALHNVEASKVAEQRYPNDPTLANILKADVLGGTTATGNWAANLVGDETSAFADFVEYLRPMTILGKFGADGVPSLRRVPFRVPLISQTAGGAGYWVGEGAPKPLTSFNFSRTTLEPLKVANIAVVTMELLRDSSPSADLILRDQLAAALRARLDTDFIDPAKSASAGVSPASILNAQTPISSTGNTADDVREDIRLLFNAFIAADNPPTSGVWIMAATTALALSLLQNPLGQAEFPGISMSGGTLFGLRVIVSEYVPSVSAGSYVALVNASDIYLGDDGGIAVDLSREASLQMLDNPTNSSATPTATQMVSMFQTNSVAFRAERTINWAVRRATSVQYLDAVNWGVAS